MTRARDLADIGDGVITAATAATVPLTLKGASGQTANLFQITNNTDQILALHNGATFFVNTTTFPAIQLTRYAAFSASAGIDLRKSNNTTLGTDTAIDYQSKIGDIRGLGYDGTLWSQATSMAYFVDGNVTDPIVSPFIPGKIVFSTGSYTTGPVEHIVIDSRGSLSIKQVLENATISATAATGTIAYDVITNRAVLYYTTNASANWTWNFRGNSTVTLNSIMAIGQTLTIATLITNGSPAYFQNSQCQVDGTTSGVTQRWQGGTAPSSGNANSIDVYTHTIIKTANATFTVLSSQTRF